jgi:death-on-curing protein
MSGPVFLSLDQVLELHLRLARVYGGTVGVRDAGLLLSAIEQPRAMFEGRWLHPRLPDMAGAYLFHLVRNHPFFDGNKRIGAAAAVIFLDLNGRELDADQEGLADLATRVAIGRAGKTDAAAFFRSRTRHR